MKFSGRITGAEELKAALKELPPVMEKQVYDQAVRRGAARFQGILKSVAPRGRVPSKASRLYGRLVENIRIRKWKNPKPGIVGYSVGIGRAFWSRWLEYGSSHQQARPFIRPTLIIFEPEFLGLLKADLALGLARAAKRLAGKYSRVRKVLMK